MKSHIAEKTVVVGLQKSCRQLRNVLWMHTMVLKIQSQPDQSAEARKEWSGTPCTQTPGKIQKADPLMGVPIKYP